MSNPKFQGDVETSDDDYVDPSIERYFKKKKSLKKEDIKKSTKIDFDNLSDYEDDEEEEEDEPDDIDQDDDDQEPQRNGNDVEMNEENSGRIRVTSAMIKKWSEELNVSLLFYEFEINFIVKIYLTNQ
jgi:CRISPR/Cas system CSM-associated protein Csm4 (group 5 of RAMP superfamily)